MDLLALDADSSLAPAFLEVALGLMESDPGLVAVGGLFYGEGGGALVGQFQRNEYTRYQRLVARKLGRVLVLTGTASVIRTYALRAVAEARGPLLPGPAGKVYDTLALTEDNELTLALKTLGARMTCPSQCRVTTEIMTSWRDLWRQRLRWHRGALENIAAYGLTRATAMYWGQQLGLAYGVVAFQLYLLLMTVSLLAADSLRWSPFWVAIGMIFVVERIVTSWAAGWKGRALAAPIFLELGYALFLQACFVTSIVQILLGRKAGWNYVPRPALPAILTPLLFSTGLLTAWGILLPTSVLTTDWYTALAGLLGRVQHTRLCILQRPPHTAADASPSRRRERRGTGAPQGPRCRLTLPELRGSHRRSRQSRDLVGEFKARHFVAKRPCTGCLSLRLVHVGEWAGARWPDGDERPKSGLAMASTRRWE